MKIGIPAFLFLLFSGFSVWKDLDTPRMIPVMYQMEAEAKKIKQVILSKEKLPAFMDSIPDMRHTLPTDPDEITEEFKVMAEENIRLRRAVYSARNPKTVYNKYIVSCITCHARHCPGPINRILKLKI